MKKLRFIILFLLLLVGYNNVNAFIIEQNIGAKIEVNENDGTFTYSNTNSSGYSYTNNINLNNEIIGISNIYNCDTGSYNCEQLILEINDNGTDTNIYTINYETESIINNSTITGIISSIKVYKGAIFITKENDTNIYKLNFTDFNILDSWNLGNTEDYFILLLGVFSDRLYYTTGDGNLREYSFYYSDYRVLGTTPESNIFYTDNGFVAQYGTGIFDYNIHTSTPTLIGDTGGDTFAGFDENGYIILGEGLGIGENPKILYNIDLGFNNDDNFWYTWISEQGLTDLVVSNTGNLTWNGAGPSFTGGVLQFGNGINREIHLATYNTLDTIIKNDYLFLGTSSGTIFNIEYKDPDHNYLLNNTKYSFVLYAEYYWNAFRTEVNSLTNYTTPNLFSYYTTDSCSINYNTTVIYEGTDQGNLYFCEEIDNIPPTTTTTNINWESGGGNINLNTGINGLYGTGVLQFGINVGSVKVNIGNNDIELNENCKILFDNDGNFLYLNNLSKTKFDFTSNINSNNLIGDRWELEVFGVNLIGWLYDFINWLAVQVLDILQIIINGLFNIFGDYIAVFQIPERDNNYCFLGANMYLNDSIKEYYSYSEGKTIIINGQSRLDYILILIIIAFIFTYFIKKI